MALVELALSAVFLIPLLVGMLDFGNYFYVASNVEEAARAGVRQAVIKQGTTSCTAVATTTATINQVTGPAVATGSACNTNVNGDAACYMNQPPLALGAAAGATGHTTVTAVCNPAGPVDPTWTVTVTTHFPLAYGMLRLVFPQSGDPACNGNKCVKYVATVTSTP